MSKIYDDFKSPGVYYRGKPFWSWNGKLEKDELLRQVDVLKEMGFGGYFMHSRTGLVTEYLGEEWFELVNAVADKGEKLGLENWLYDEDRWPSGTAGGFVTMNPDYSASYIRCEPTDGRDSSTLIFPTVISSHFPAICSPKRAILHLQTIKLSQRTHPRKNTLIKQFFPSQLKRLQREASTTDIHTLTR